MSLVKFVKKGQMALFVGETNCGKTTTMIDNLVYILKEQKYGDHKKTVLFFTSESNSEYILLKIYERFFDINFTSLLQILKNEELGKDLHENFKKMIEKNTCIKIIDSNNINNLYEYIKNISQYESLYAIFIDTFDTLMYDVEELNELFKSLNVKKCFISIQKQREPIMKEQKQVIEEDLKNEFKFAYVHESKDGKKLSTNRVMSIMFDAQSNPGIVTYYVTFCSQRDREDRFCKNTSREILKHRYNEELFETCNIFEKPTYQNVVNVIIGDILSKKVVGGINVPSWATKMLKKSMVYKI